MPRIRSIKPEFATDGDMLRLSDSCALFFVLLWNFCDDEGKHPLDPKQLAAEMGGRWHQGKVKLFLSCLVNSGQLRINSDSTWIQVTGWSHQRIDKPKQPKVKAADLQWLTHEESRTILDKSRTIRARIGSDRIGEDIPTGVGKPKASRKPRKPKIPTGVGDLPVALPKGEVLATSEGPDPNPDQQLALLAGGPIPTKGGRFSEPTRAKMRAFIGAYANSYREKYHSPPEGIRDKAIIGKIGHWIESVSEDRAVQLAQVYLQIEYRPISESCHDLWQFFRHLNRIGNALTTGEDPSAINWAKVFGVAS